jgi:hypothetical protein
MNKLLVKIALFVGVVFSQMSIAGWTSTTEVTSVGQYGHGAIYFTTTDEVSSCGNKNKLFFYTKDATEPEKLYSALLTAFVSGKRIRVFLHDNSSGGVNCGGESAQQIINPNYFYISN